MKSFSTLLILVLFSYWAKPQDTIFLYNQNTQVGKIIKNKKLIVKYIDYSSNSRRAFLKGEIKKINFSDKRVEYYLPKILKLYPHSNYANQKFSSQLISDNYIFWGTRPNEYFSGGIKYSGKELINKLEYSYYPEVRELIKKSKRNKKLTKLGYLSIPIALSGLAVAVLGDEPGYGSGLTEIGVTIFAMGLLTPSVSICFKSLQLKNFRNAIHKHNQKTLEKEIELQNPSNGIPEDHVEEKLEK